MKPIALNMVAEIARDAETHGLPISGIGGITTWRDAAEFMALGAGNVQVCTAAMTYGFKIVQEMIAGLKNWMDEKGHAHARRLRRPRGAQRHRLAVSQPQLRRQGAHRPGPCIKCGRCHIACEDTSHQAITQLVDGVRHFEVIEDECVGCNLCVNVCPVENCITMVPLAAGVMDQRTNKPVSPDYANWTRTRTIRWRRWRRSSHSPSRQAASPALSNESRPAARRACCSEMQCLAISSHGRQQPAISACWSHSMLLCRRSTLKPIPTSSSKRPDPVPVSGWFAAADRRPQPAGLARRTGWRHGRLSGLARDPPPAQSLQVRRPPWAR